jgi:hypothetical protein
MTLAPWSVDVSRTWVAMVNELQPQTELSALRRDHVNRGRPYGDADGVSETVRRLGLQSTARRVGRPRKERE